MTPLERLARINRVCVERYSREWFSMEAAEAMDDASLSRICDRGSEWVADMEQALGEQRHGG